MPLFSTTLDHRNPPLQFTIAADQTFEIDLNQDEKSFSITITNPTKDQYMYKMKLSNFDLFTVTPYQGIIENGGKIVISVTIKKSTKTINFLDPKQSHSRFLCEYTLYKPKMGAFDTAWQLARHGGNNKDTNQTTTTTTNTKSQQSTTTSSTSSSTSTGTTTSIPSPTPSNFYSYKFLGKILPPIDIPLNYTEFLEQKCTSQARKIESISWLLAEQVERIRQLEDANIRLQRKIQRFELQEMARNIVEDQEGTIVKAEQQKLVLQHQMNEYEELQKLEADLGLVSRQIVPNTNKRNSVLLHGNNINNGQNDDTININTNHFDLSPINHNTTNTMSYANSTHLNSQQNQQQRRRDDVLR